VTSDNAPLKRIRKAARQSRGTRGNPRRGRGLTGKAAQLMARYGIDRALLAATQPQTDQPADKVITIPSPWAAVHAHLLCGIASAMRCRCILLNGAASGTLVHIFGYACDIERTEILYTSLLLQMHHALAATPAPQETRSVRAWRRSWLLGFATAVTARVRAAEQNAAGQTAAGPVGTGTQTAAVVLASREQVIARRAATAYPITRTARVTYSGTGYRDGYTTGTRADIGTTRLSPRPTASLR